MDGGQVAALRRLKKSSFTNCTVDHPRPIPCKRPALVPPQFRAGRTPIHCIVQWVPRQHVGEESEYVAIGAFGRRSSPKLSARGVKATGGFFVLPKILENRFSYRANRAHAVSP